MVKASSEYPSVVTDVSTVTLLPGSVLDWRYAQGVNVSLKEAAHESERIGLLMKEQGVDHCRLLIDVRDMGSITREARRYFASQEVHDNYGVIGLALLIGSPIGTMVGNLYFSLNPTLHPTRLFTDRDIAMRWLLKLEPQG